MTEINLHALPQTIEGYLHQQGWISWNRKVLSLEKPGEGNMNVVIRVKLDDGSLILKQARPYVQKYPQIPAPLERITVESRFYDLADTNEVLSEYLPGVIGFDPEQYIFALEDLGETADYTFLYGKGANVEPAELEAAVCFLSQLHHIGFSDAEKAGFPANMALRQLNHEHLIVYPYLMDNGFNLDSVQPGLQETAMAYKADEELKKQICQLGERYLASGSTLLHGDYYPGSWLRAGGRFRVIDPEFCFFGPAEYDYGVMVAHFMLAQLPQRVIDQALNQYDTGELDMELAAKFTGMEILRRIIGLAQLPLDLTLDERSLLLTEAAALVKS
ncbi:MAG: phosphotransferase [Saprospiraceae bacterium]